MKNIIYFFIALCTPALLFSNERFISDSVKSYTFDGMLPNTFASDSIKEPFIWDLIIVIDDFINPGSRILSKHFLIYDNDRHTTDTVLIDDYYPGHIVTQNTNAFNNLQNKTIYLCFSYKLYDKDDYLINTYHYKIELTYYICSKYAVVYIYNFIVNKKYQKEKYKAKYKILDYFYKISSFHMYSYGETPIKGTGKYISPNAYNTRW